MKPAFRSTALAAALAAVSCGALAEKIDFESFWDASIKANDPPKAVGAQDVKGFLFSTDSAWAYKKEMLKPGITADKDVLPDVWDMDQPGVCAGSAKQCNNTGFIMNRTRGKGGNLIEISLDPTLFNGRFITNIGLDLFHNAPAGKITALNAAGQQADLDGFTNGLRVWTFWQADLTKLAFQDVTTLRFDFGGAALGLDNLDFTLSGSGGGGGNVPEPGSYALVGLALLAAGAARRRKA